MCALLVGLAAPLSAQNADRQDRRSEDPDAIGEVIVRGARGSAIADIAPVATFDPKFIEATGATSMNELLRILTPMARSADGADPIILLNGQRTSSWEEVQSLPPEALAGTEILPESAAIKYGYPPTRRLLNFMTKPRFRSYELSANGGRSTAGGAGSYGANAALTRIANRRRLSLAAEYRHTDPLRTSRRPFALDPDSLFDPAGNIEAAASGEIDPALSSAAGEAIFATGVPADLQLRSRPSAYLATAGQLNIFDVRPLNTLIARADTLKGSAVLKAPLAAGVDGTVTFTAERAWGRSLHGYPTLTIFVPASNPYSPFDTDLLLFRAVKDKIIKQRTGATTLNAGSVVQGGIAGWQWDVTTTLERITRMAWADRGYDPQIINRAAAAGANPFGDLDSSLLGARLSQNATVTNRKAELKAVARGTLLRLPAGTLAAVATVEGGLLDAHSRSRGFVDTELDVKQSRVEAGLTVEIPLTSRRDEVLAFLGDWSASLTGRIRNVRSYGQLHDTTYGLNWTPLKGLQLTATRNNTQAAPNIDYRSAATVENPNIPFFDFRTGRTVYVTLVTGGKPELAPERRRVQSYGFTLKPFDKAALTLSGTYSSTLIHDVTGVVAALTPATEAELPGQFLRDRFGRLTTVVIRPRNFYRQRQRSLSFQVNFWGQLGRPVAADPGKPPQERSILYLGAAPTLNLRDRLEINRGSEMLDLLGGDTIDASAYHYRLAVWGWGGLSKAGNGVTFNAAYQGPSRVHGGAPRTELRFGSRVTLDVSGFVALHHWLPQQDWLRKTRLTLQVMNPLDSRQRVRDANGNTPFRYQRYLLDPQGRTVKVTFRKLFQ